MIRWRSVSIRRRPRSAATPCSRNSTTPKEDAVTLGVQFNRLPNGTTYPQQVLLDVADKKIQVTIVNSGYAKVAQ